MDKIGKEKQKQAKEIQRLLNKFRKEINKEAGCEIMPYEAKVVFEEEKDDISRMES